MRSFRVASAVAVIVAVAAACATIKPLLPRLPWLEDRVRIPHERHKKADVDCLACHETVYDATDLEARHLPPEAKCMECHSEERDKNNCKFCHSEVRGAQNWRDARPTLAFNHVNHLERTGEDCTKCHTADALPEYFKRGGGVPMDTCLGCHEHKEEYLAGRCDRCHLDITADRLIPRQDFTHQGNYVQTHRTWARSSSDSCMVCHSQAQCVNCHNATPGTKVELLEPAEVARNFTHRNDFIARHSMEAQADPAQCYRCHKPDTCVSCHRQQNLTPDGSDPRNPHPVNYVRRGGSAFHGDEARMDIQRCAACHDQGQQSNCVQCHQSGGVGGNPHPPSWNLDHSLREIPSNGMCQYCHH